MTRTKKEIIGALVIAVIFWAIGYFFGIGATYERFTDLAFKEMRYDFENKRKQNLFQVGPFWFVRKNPYLYQVTIFDPQIAGIESLERKRK